MRHTLAVLQRGVTEEVGLAAFAVVALGVVQALEALPGRSVAASGDIGVDVVVALAGLALAARHERVAEEVLSAASTVVASVARGAIANHVVGVSVQRTRLSVLVSAGCSSRAHARAAAERGSRVRVAIVTILAPGSMS